MSSFTNCPNFWRGRGRLRGRFRFMCMHRIHIYRAHAVGRGRWLRRLFVSDVALCRVRNRQPWCEEVGPKYSQKTTHQIDRICSTRVSSAVASAGSLVVCMEHTLHDEVEALTLI